MSPVRSLWSRAALSLTLTVTVIVALAGYLAFAAMLHVEDSVLEKVLTRVFACADGAPAAELKCLGVRRASATWSSQAPGLVEDGDLDYVVDARGRAIPTQPFEVIDPWESTFGSVLGIVLIASIAVALGAALLLLRRALHPITSLEVLLKQTPSEDLVRRLDLAVVPREVDGLKRKLARALETADAARLRERMFSRYVSHELRTPLSVSRASIDLLDEPNVSNAIRLRTFQRLRRAVLEMEETVSILLELARGERRNIADNQGLEALVDEELARARVVAEYRGSALRREGSAKGALVPGGASLRLVLRNLLSNAIRHCEGGRVTVSVSHDAIQVADEGQGVAQDELERLTLPFESRAANGYGLGLALVKDICEREGWVLSFESPEGEGLSVVVRFHGVESEASLTKVLSNGGARPVPDDSR